MPMSKPKKVYTADQLVKRRAQWKDWYERCGRAMATSEEGKAKRREVLAEYRDKNRERLRERHRKWRVRNKAKIREYSKNTREKFRDERREYNRQYAKDHPEWLRAKAARRRARKHNAYPKWSTPKMMGQIGGFFRRARSLTKKTGIEHHADHIVPLRGKYVCGLHVPWNLQVLPIAENRNKGNKHESEQAWLEAA